MIIIYDLSPIIVTLIFIFAPLIRLIIYLFFHFKMIVTQALLLMSIYMK